MAILIPAEGLPGTVIQPLDVGPYMLGAARQKAASASKYKLPTDGAWERDNQFQSTLLTVAGKVISDPTLSERDKALRLAQISVGLQKSKNYGAEYDKIYNKVLSGTDEEKKAYDEETLEYNAIQRSPTIWSAAGLKPEDVTFHPITGEVLIKNQALQDFSFESDEYGGTVRPFGQVESPQLQFDKFRTLVAGIRIPYQVNETGDVTIKDVNKERLAGQISGFIESNVRGKRVLREYTNDILAENGITIDSPNYQEAMTNPSYQKMAIDRMNEDIINRADMARTLDEAGGGVGFVSTLGINPYLYQDPTTQKEIAQTSFDIAGTLNSSGVVAPTGSATSNFSGRAISFKPITIKPGGAKAPAYDISGYGQTDDGKVFLLGQMASGSALSGAPASAIQKFVTEGIVPIFADANVLSSFYSAFKAGGKIKGKVDASTMGKIISQQTSPYMTGVSTMPSWAAGSLNP